jgi:hypothetical protein
MRVKAHLVDTVACGRMRVQLGLEVVGFFCGAQRGFAPYSALALQLGSRHCAPPRVTARCSTGSLV